MSKFRPLLAAAAMTMALPVALASTSFAQGFGGQSGGARGGGGGAPAAAAPSGGGGGFSSGGRSFGGGGGPQMGGGPRMGGGGPVFNGGGSPRGQVFAGPGTQSGNWRPGPGMRPPYHHRPGWGGGFWPGVGVGAAFAAAPYYYGDSYYYDDGYYDDSVTVQAAPSDGADVSYCVQRYKSYDINSRTFLGYDGQRHPCP